MRSRSLFLIALALAIAGGLAALHRWSSATRAPSRPATPSPVQRTRVEWLLDHRLPCLGCHTYGGRGGRLGPDLTEVGLRLSRDQIEQQINDPLSRNPSSIMPPTPMPAEWQLVLVDYFSRTVSGQAVPKTTGGIERKRFEPQVESGASIYGRLCSGCHGTMGRGDGPNASWLPVPPARHADARVMELRTDDWLFDMISVGGYPMGHHPFMPAYAGLLSPTEIRLVIGHLRQLCRCIEPSWAHDSRSATR